VAFWHLAQVRRWKSRTGRSRAAQGTRRPRLAVLVRGTLSAAVCTDRRMTAATTVVLDTLIRQSHACPQELAGGGTAPGAPDLLFQADWVVRAQHPAREQVCRSVT